MHESKLTGDDFESTSWHDNHVYDVDLRLGNPEADDWTSDLILDIDHILEWVRDDDGISFRIAPATLTFHGVSDLRIDLDWAVGDLPVAPYVLSIDRIERRRVVDQKVFLDRPYYAWTIEMNSPQGGIISFGAVDFTQVLRAEPRLSREQLLGCEHRDGLAPS